MELWIRSQDKENLIKVDEVYIEEILETTVFITNKYNIGEWLIECKDTILGVYKTKERALEELDEIQRLITDLQYMSYAIDSSSFFSYRPNVYEMPKE